jgi:tRNA(Ile2) C34 agmatinyltransferase TiaS
VAIDPVALRQQQSVVSVLRGGEPAARIRAAERHCPKCGLRTESRGRVCSRCKNNRHPKLPEVALLPTEYLLTCVEELKRRRDEITNALGGER